MEPDLRQVQWFSDVAARVRAVERDLEMLEARRKAALKYMELAAPPRRQTGPRAQQIRWHFLQIERALTGTSLSDDEAP